MNRIWIVVLMCTLWSCKTQKDLMTTVEEVPIEEEVIHTAVTEEDYEERELEELVISAPRHFSLPLYNPAEDRAWDLQHMDLDLRFDWTNEKVFGRAEISMKPYFYDQSKVVLDAQGFEIIDIASANGTILPHNYNGKKLEIDFGRIYTREEEVLVVIDYVANPAAGPEGGSSAITSDQGLFFIDPRDEDPEKPTQIWTQGETEHNSRWFPTIDKPNEQITHEISMTVSDKYVTLSNGTLVDTKSYGNGTHMDTWRMDQPHAPYLVMIAVGAFAVVKEEHNGLLLEYYVEPAYEQYAQQIFAHTPEMIDYFSDILDYPYPWDKYSQIITRDYVSGAMENTTAVIFGDFVQKTDRELIDDDNDFIVAHELFHHWFGDLVTCESWANLTLQEGFANYSEHLWQEYKYGMDAAGYQRQSEKQGYLASIMQTGMHPLIHYGYGDKEEMFDGHSYNKGGLVLHMLRHQLGDDAFFAGLNKYLTDHKHTAVEVDELRMAFEDVSGLDLHWFFDQWYLASGHPLVELFYDYNDTTNTLTVQVDQTQNAETAKAIFQLPVTLAVFDDQGVETQFDLFINKRSQTIELPYNSLPALVVFDRDDHLLMVKSEVKTVEEYIHQYDWMDTYIHRYEAIDNIKGRAKAQTTLEKALGDNHFAIRKMAVDHISTEGLPELLKRLSSLALTDPHSAVRSSAISRLAIEDKEALSDVLAQVFDKEQSYDVLSSAMDALNQIDPDAALDRAIALKSEPTAKLVGAVSAILAQSGDQSHLPYFEDKLTSVSFYSVFSFYDSYRQLMEGLSPSEILTKSKGLSEIGRSPVANVFYRFAATHTLDQIRTAVRTRDSTTADEITGLIEEIKEYETHPMLSQRYQGY